MLERYFGIHPVLGLYIDITMRILLTGAGSPATWGTVQSLWDHRIVGADVREVTTPGVEQVFQVPEAGPDFAEALLEVCIREKISVVIPQVEQELFHLSRERKLFEACGIRVLVSSPSALAMVGKLELYRNFGDLAPAYRYIKSGSRGDHGDVARAVYEIGLPCVVKLLGNSGGNGVRIVKEAPDFEDFAGKPNGVISFADLMWSLGDKSYELIISAMLPGAEYTVDVLCDGGAMKVCVPRRRDVIRTGITFEGETVEHKGIIEACDRIVRETGLDFVVGFQFKEDARGRVRLLECNPRVQGTTIHSTLAGANIIRAAVAGASVSQSDVMWGVKLSRYWGASVR